MLKLYNHATYCCSSEAILIIAVFSLFLIIFFYLTFCGRLRICFLYFLFVSFRWVIEIALCTSALRFHHTFTYSVAVTVFVIAIILLPHTLWFMCTCANVHCLLLCNKLHNAHFQYNLWFSFLLSVYQLCQSVLYFFVKKKNLPLLVLLITSSK